MLTDWWAGWRADYRADGLAGGQTHMAADRVAVTAAGRAGAGGLRASRITDGFVASRGVDRIADGQDGGEAYVVVAYLSLLVLSRLSVLVARQPIEL